MTFSKSGFASCGLAAVLVMAGISSAGAQQQGPRGPGGGFVSPTIQLLDLDGDGSVGAAEIADEQQRLFTAIDVLPVNGGEAANAAELVRWYGSRRARYRGLPRVGIQQKLAGSVANIRRIITLLGSPICAPAQP